MEAPDITNWLTASGTRFAAGCVIFWGILKLSKEIEERLSENTKVNVWVWLAGQKPVGPEFQRWPDTVSRIFDRVYGERALSLRAFVASCASSAVVMLLFLIADLLRGRVGE